MNTEGWGISHLSGMPVTLTFGTVLLIVVGILVLLRFAFAGVSVSGSAGVK